MKGGLEGLRREQTRALLEQAWMVRILKANPLRKFWPARFVQHNALWRGQGSLGTAAWNGGRGRHAHLGVFGLLVLLEFELNGESEKKNPPRTSKSVFDTLRLPQEEGFYNRREKKEMCLP